MKTCRKIAGRNCLRLLALTLWVMSRKEKRKVRKLLVLGAAALVALLCADNANAWGGRCSGGRCSGGSCYTANRSCFGGSCYSGGYTAAPVNGCIGGGCPLTTNAEPVYEIDPTGSFPPAIRKGSVKTPAPCYAVQPYAEKPQEETPQEETGSPAPCESVETVDEPVCTPCGSVQTIKARRLPVLCKDGTCRLFNVPKRAAQTTVNALFNAINAIRGRALAFDARLQAQAKYQAQRMAVAGRLFHSGLGWEICAQTWTSTDAVDAWYKSKAGHKEIMLGNFSRCGAATCTDSQGRVWSCARFE